MKKPLYLAIAAVTICTVVFSMVITHTNKLGENESEEQDGMDLAWQQEFEMTKDPALNYVPKERLIKAWNYTKASLLQKSTQAIPNIEWKPLGSKNYGGRTRALLVDLNDNTRKTVFAGSVGGGLWKTTDVTASEPNWTPVNDLFGNLAISSLAQDPTNTQVIYFGTGEGYGNSDATRGMGIWKSTDGGTTWNQLSSTNNSTFYYTYKVFVSSTGVLFACTQNGLYRSTNGGTSFTKVLGTGLSITGANSNIAYDIEEAANGNMYCSLSGSIHKSTNAGVNWTPALAIGVTGSRIEIATAPGNSNYVYALVANGNTINAIIFSNDGGTTFTTKTKPADADTGIPASDFSRSQAWYDLTIAVSPSDANSVFVGGVDIFRSLDNGTTWGQLTHWYGGFGYQNVHADQHNIVFTPGNANIMYFVNDGGIYRTSNGSDGMPTIVNKDANYNTLQFYGCGMSPTAGSFEFVAGAQDNGSHKFTQNILANTTEVTSGDGALCHIDQNQPQYWFTSYVYNNYYRSSDNGATFTSASFSSSNGRFINPTDYDDAANLMYCAHSNNNYLRWENPQTGSTFTVVSCPTLNGNISAIKVSPNTANRVFFGTGTGTIVKVDNANTNAPVAQLINNLSPMPGGYVSCIEVQPGNDNHILVTFSNYGVNSIWETTDGGINWTSIEGNLPDMPVRWIIFNPVNNDQALIATELGVWSTDDLNGGSTVWASSNNGLANVRVDMLQSRSSDKLIIAATHGRGLYYTGAFSPATASFNISSKIIYPGRSLQFTNTSLNSTSTAWDFGDGTTSTQQNPLKKFSNPGTYTVTLNINGGASVTTQTITVMPWSGTPYTLAQGGNFEINTTHFAAETISGTGWERGNSAIPGKKGVNSGSNAWVTGLVSSNYVDNSESYLYTPSYNLSTAGTYNFSFYTKYSFESDYDGFRVEYSLDTGKNWIPLNPYVAANWYNSANTSGTTIFPAGQAFFSGAVTVYTQQNCDISFLAGQSQVAFRFAFKSDEGVTSIGAAIDDVQITGSANNPLPLNLLSFTATKENRDAQLQWSTSNEVNVSYFDIERSWNGSEFSAVARKNALNGIQNNYALKDLLGSLSVRPSNTTYYRLKMVDRDGRFTYSKIEILKWNDLQSSQVNVYPNPFKDYIQISTQLKVNGVQLLDNSGKVVASSNTLNNGRFNLPALPTGTYYLRLITTEGIITQKVMKQ